MKNKTSRTGYVYLLTKAVSAAVSAVTVVGLLRSAEYDHRMVVPGLFLFLATMEKDMLSVKHQKTVCKLTGAAAVITALIIISQVGLWILNVRYLAAVLFTTLTVMAAAEAVFFTLENIKRKTLV
jgi:hypothetical protein